MQACSLMSAWLFPRLQKGNPRILPVLDTTASMCFVNSGVHSFQHSTKYGLIVSSVDDILQKSVHLSINNLMEESVLSPMSLRNEKNIRGPHAVLWGTPESIQTSTWTVAEATPLQQHCFLVVSHISIYS